MKIIIDIQKEDYIGICNLSELQLSMLPTEVAETLMLIKNGVVLDDNTNSAK